MDQELDVSRNVYLDRDQRGTVLQLRHLDAPFLTPARTPQLAAAEYLHSFADLLQITAPELANLATAPATTPEPADVEFRYAAEKSQFDSTTVAYVQTVLGLPVFGAGLAVQLQTNPMRVLSSQSTQHPEVQVEMPDADVLKRAESLTVTQLAHSLGLPARDGGDRQPLRKSLEIEGRALVVYRYEPDQVQRDRSSDTRHNPTRPNGNGRAAAAAAALAEQGDLPWLALPPVPDTVTADRHYVCVKVSFGLTVPSWGSLFWTAILDVDTLTVLYLRPHVDDVTGLVFDVDPVTTNNGPGPSATSTALNPFRVAENLVGLVPPSGGVQALTGNTIALIDSESPTVAAPTRTAGTNFDFDVRSDDFSAVNAYVHCDRFFRLVDSMGFTRSGYFPGTAFPTSVDFRGFDTVSPPNAHCVGTAGNTGILRTTFHLADGGDTAHPIGLADDFRVVLHELGGHGVLYNHVSSPNFGFAHSAGDSVAAILNDPGTQSPDRFLTFPWVASVISRRHDRLPSGGFGWAGSIALNPFSNSLDRGGYNNEQILSSTMFRIYRSIGGDSANITTQRFAARMSVYLILRAIATLTPATNPGTATGFETALETADRGDWISENLTGGAYRKVIRWAFEKQGMFQPAGTVTPNNNVGAPPAVDVYVNDGRAGEYQYQPVFWENQNIWNRLASDGGTTHQDPVTNRTNYAYVKIRNRGTQPATNVVVKAFRANPAAGLSYPNDWIPMTTAQLPAANVPANNAGEITVGPFAWTPRNVGHECMFMIVSATGDESNVDHLSAGAAIPEWRLVPNDNNIGQRNVAPVPGGTTGLTAEFTGLTFEVKNPLLTTAVMQVEHTLPPLLLERGWSLNFTNRGGSVFKLAPDESRDVVMELVPGKDFTPADVEAVTERTILVAARADGILVGGMSYQLDPTITRPNRPGHEHDDHCGCQTDPHLGQLAEVLVRSLERRRHRVRDVEITKVVLEIDLEDECD